MLKKTLVVVAVLLLLLLLGNFTVGDRLMLSLVQRQAAKSLSGQALSEFGDGLNVVLCGAGSPFPDTTRSGPCVAVIAGEQILIVDVGSGSARQLAPAGIPAGRVAAVLLTHFHSDHIDGLGELLLQRWGTAAHEQPTPVLGPPGVEQVVEGFNRAYGLDAGYRVAHHGPKIIPPGGAGGIARPFVLPAAGEGLVVWNEGGLKVTAFVVDHAPISPAVGYRFDYRGRSALISGDTRKSTNLAQFAKGVDLLVHEALSEELVDAIAAGAQQVGAANIVQIMQDIHGYHTTPVEAAEIAQAAGAKHLLYYHLVPAMPLRRLEPIFLRGVSKVYDGGVTLGQDRSWVRLPPNSDELIVGHRGQF